MEKIKRMLMKITREQQLSNKANFVSDTGSLYLVRCVACDRENYALNVSYGTCCWCGWSEENKEMA
jgi:hypothetical protein